MKVLALVVLVIAVSGLEAGVVKREVPSLDELTKILSTWADTVKTQTQEWIDKVQNGEVKAQTEPLCNCHLQPHPLPLIPAADCTGVMGSSVCNNRHGPVHLGIIRITASGIPISCFNMVDEATRRVVSEIPLLKTLASPRDKELWVQRLKEEYQALIKYVENNKNADNDWFRLESNKEGTRWFGKCWYIHDLLKYEFDVEFDVLLHYHTVIHFTFSLLSICRGGKICLTEHFKPLWARNVPKFGLGHLMALGLGPWLAVEIPDLISKGLVEHKSK
ncbi:hypothetical protein XELAEV_18042902mg [Xenopus laevis]|uniref:Ubiquitin-fold modifier-conjugating enzyme 1 n=1 Tax=Xenopus laevis TaxID=8355 RepID=A0A974H6T0_XENLA|nr:hypothetical protein XELAEV_18042902mg [Xenopus laevis]